MAAPPSIDPDREQCSRIPPELAIASAGALGAALRRSRKALGLTQAELALAAGVGLRFVGEVEAGKASVQLEQLLRVIDALGGTLLLRDAAGSRDA
jgi:y4mF family transcriptional regulator